MQSRLPHPDADDSMRVRRRGWDYNEESESLDSLLRECEEIDVACACAQTPQPTAMDRGSPESGDEAACAICFGSMRHSDGRASWTCEVCLNATHAECFDVWRKYSTRGSPSCPFCRHAVKEEGNAGCCAVFVTFAIVLQLTSSFKAHTFCA